MIVEERANLAVVHGRTQRIRLVVVIRIGEAPLEGSDRYRCWIDSVGYVIHRVYVVLKFVSVAELGSKLESGEMPSRTVIPGCGEGTLQVDLRAVRRADIDIGESIQVRIKDFGEIGNTISCSWLGNQLGFIGVRSIQVKDQWCWIVGTLWAVEIRS